MMAPGGPALAHSTPTSQRGHEGSKRGPWTLQRLPRERLRTPREAQETPKGVQEGAKRAQERFKMAQVGSKVGPEMRKVANVKLLKKPLVFNVFRAFWPSQDDPRRAPNRPLRPKRTSRRAEEDVKTAQETCQMVNVTCQ